MGETKSLVLRMGPEGDKHRHSAQLPWAWPWGARVTGQLISSL